MSALEELRDRALEAAASAWARGDVGKAARFCRVAWEVTEWMTPRSTR
jgi:hypothetical protein